MTRKLLYVVGTALLLLGLVALSISFAARRDARQEIQALSIRLDNTFDDLKADRNTEVLQARIEDIRGDLIDIELSYDSLTSPMNLPFLLYAGLTFGGIWFIFAGSRLRRVSNPQDGG